jgi:hypothetical protein
MTRFFTVAVSFFVFVAFMPAQSSAQATCPPEVAEAKAMLAGKQTAKVAPGDVQAPRSLAGARQDIQQAPRSGDVQQAPRTLAPQQAPRSAQEAPRAKQDIQQAPRSAQEAPRGTQEAPRSAQEAPRADAGSKVAQQAPRADITKATALVNEAEAACKVGNMTMASEKAKAALEIIKK